MKLPLKSMIRLSNDYTFGFLTEHNRQSLGLNYEEVGSSSRTVNGTLRGHVVARKKLIQISWQNVPSDASVTLDGYWSGEELRQFYETYLNEFNVKVYTRDKAQRKYADSNPEYDLTMKFDSFNFTIVGRNVRKSSGVLCDLWNVDLSLKEV